MRAWAKGGRDVWENGARMPGYISRPKDAPPWTEAQRDRFLARISIGEGIRLLPREELGQQPGVHISAPECFVRQDLPVEVDGVRNTFNHRFGERPFKPRDRLCPVLAVCNDLAKQ